MKYNNKIKYYKCKSYEFQQSPTNFLCKFINNLLCKDKNISFSRNKQIYFILMKR